jgi:hypothetical protein
VLGNLLSHGYCAKNLPDETHCQNENLALSSLSISNQLEYMGFCKVIEVIAAIAAIARGQFYATCPLLPAPCPIPGTLVPYRIKHPLAFDVN